MKLYSIRQYVIWLTMIPLLLMAIGLEVYFLRERSVDLDQDLIERGKLIARQLASGSEYGVFANNQPFLQNLAQGVLQQPDVRGVIILNAASKRLIEQGDFSDEQKMQARKWVNAQTPINSVGDSLWVYEPILPAQVALDDLGDKPAVREMGAVIVKMSWEHTKDIKLRMFGVMTTATAFFLLVSFLLRLFASRRITLPVCELNDAVVEITKGHLETRVTETSHVAELNNLASGINGMASRLQQEISALKKSESQLHNLSAHLQHVREEEKASLAREIHDHLGGTLTALKMDMNWLADKMSAKSDASPFLKHLESMSQLLDTATDATRRVITDLRPSILDDLGLCAALEWQAAQFQKRTGIECTATCCAENYTYQLDKTQMINLFRIFQESLTNVLRHSGATKVKVDLDHENENIVLTISDNGCGLAEGHVTAPTSYGMLGMRERVEQMQGEINFGNLPGGGFSVKVTLPLVTGNKTGVTA